MGIGLIYKPWIALAILVMANIIDSKNRFFFLLYFNTRDYRCINYRKVYNLNKIYQMVPNNG